MGSYIDRYTTDLSLFFCRHVKYLLYVSLQAVTMLQVHCFINWDNFGQLTHLLNYLLKHYAIACSVCASYLIKHDVQVNGLHGDQQ